jgi:hypothetical protein
MNDVKISIIFITLLKHRACATESLHTHSTMAHAALISVIQQGIASMDEVVYLVSQDGKKYPIQEQVLKGSSDFFWAALEINMRESGKYPFVGKRRSPYHAIHF